MHEKQSVRAPRNIFQEKTREKECMCVRVCGYVYMGEQKNERERKIMRDVAIARCSKEKSQKSNKLTVLLSSVDALIKEK